MNPKNMRRKQVRKLGYSFQLVARLDDDGREARHVMSYGSVGRSDAKQRVSEIQEYVTNGDVSGAGRLRVLRGVRGRHPARHLRRLLAHLLPHPGPVLGAAAAAEAA